MLLELPRKSRQAIVASRHQHLCPILPLFLFQEKAFITRLQNRHHARLLLHLLALEVTPQLVRHLTQLRDTFLEDGKLRNERLRHQLLILLRVDHVLRLL